MKKSLEIELQLKVLLAVKENYNMNKYFNILINLKYYSKFSNF
jgi:hypothetical protein